MHSEKKATKYLKTKIIIYIYIYIMRIKDLKQIRHCFRCKKCCNIYMYREICNRHEKTCNEYVMHTFPGGNMIK